MTRCKTLHRSS